MHRSFGLVFGSFALLSLQSVLAQTCALDVTADVNNDCVVDPLDTGFVLSRFNCPVGTGDAGCDAADANGDGRVDPLDSGFVLSRFCTGVDTLTIALDAVGETTNEAFVTLAGTTKGAATVEVVGGEFPVIFDVLDCAFSGSVILIPNRINFLFLTAIAADGRRGPAFPVKVTQDEQAPFVFVDFPAGDTELTTDSTDVAGRVSDLLSGFEGLVVEVNGVKALVDVGIGTNGTFLVTQVPLEIGENQIVATATDLLGNTASHTVSIQRVEVPRASRLMTVVSGNAQMAEVFAELADPIVVKVTSVSGKPQVGKVVTFQVTRNDGRLASSSNGAGAAMLQAFTDSNGEARAFWRLGGTAGSGNNRVEVTSTDVIGSTFFCATGTPGEPDQINIGSGNMQRGQVGAPAPGQLVAWVSDSCNPVPFVPVTFTVVTGGGLVNGEASTIVLADFTGHAAVDFTLGPAPGMNIIAANTKSNTGSPAVFTIHGTEGIPGQSTSFSGIVLNNAQNPIQGAMCELEIGDLTFGPVFSDVDGRFEFTNLASAGAAELSVEGATAFHIGGVDGRAVPLNTYPALHYSVVITPQGGNGLGMPVLLPPKNPVNNVLFDNTEDVELTCEGIEGLKMIVKAGSVRLKDGTVPSPTQPTVLSLNQVHHDDIPMPMPDGVDPPFAWTLQPGGTLFDPPVEITYPNMSGLPAGAIANFLSFNHDTMQFEIVASGQVSADGQVITTDPGSGISTAGWGCNCPPYSVTSNCCHCNDSCQTCVNGACITLCPAGQTCCGDACCEGVCCDGICNLDPSAECCGNGQICAVDTTCCGEGGACCGSDEVCCGGFGQDEFCCDSEAQCCGAAGCCAEGQVCCFEQCFDAGTICCETPEKVACDETHPICCGEFSCCAEGEECCDGHCQPAGTVCCTDGQCPDECGVCINGACVGDCGTCQKCVDGECEPCGADEVCCGLDCQPAGSTCCEAQSDCDACEKCESGVCVDANCGDCGCKDGECVGANDCEKCVDGTSVPCNEDEEICCSGKCVSADSECCSGDGDCECGTCIGGVCVGFCGNCQKCEDGACIDCEAGEGCCEGVCQPAGIDCCQEDGTCPNGCDECIDGACVFKGCGDGCICSEGTCLCELPCNECVDGSCVPCSAVGKECCDNGQCVAQGQSCP